MPVSRKANSVIGPGIPWRDSGLGRKSLEPHCPRQVISKVDVGLVRTEII